MFISGWDFFNLPRIEGNSSQVNVTIHNGFAKVLLSSVQRRTWPINFPACVLAGFFAKICEWQYLNASFSVRGTTHLIHLQPPR